MHSVRLEPTNLVAIGTRTTYQATGDGMKSEKRDEIISTQNKTMSIIAFSLTSDKSTMALY